MSKNHLIFHIYLDTYATFNDVECTGGRSDGREMCRMKAFILSVIQHVLFYYRSIHEHCAVSVKAKHSICSIPYLKHAQIHWLIQMVKYNSRSQKSFHIYRYIKHTRTHAHTCEFGVSLTFPMNVDAFLLFLINELRSFIESLEKSTLSLCFVSIRYSFLFI